MAVSILGALIIILYYIAVVFVGVWSGRKVHGDQVQTYVSGKHKDTHKDDDNDYLLRLFLANRSVPVALGVVSMTATWVGGALLNTTAETVFTSGIVWCQAPFGYGLSLMVGAPSPFPGHPDWAPSVFVFRKADPAALTKKCNRFERSWKRKRVSAADNEAIAALLLLGNIEVDPTPTEADGEAAAPLLQLNNEADSSECWGGKVSDKQLVLLTDFTKKLEYGDEVMADRGFNVTEELAVLGHHTNH
ncbi:hypothetical protein HPB52_023718 [Rhipicephalus sanguineus]|uniref:DDE Tnp4 domain-containing protein n=1 Tax=Rhipicephalus sanguineus TaxID=34632 RepID=A0A9D4TCA3_RHISA|nr:hypothetical protein HPB52_023718 [Rhipicephalus sanguineus]